MSLIEIQSLNDSNFEIILGHDLADYKYGGMPI